MRFFLDETQEQTTVVSFPTKPFWLPRPIPCPKLPPNLEAEWVVERMFFGVRIAIVNRDGELHAYHDKQRVDDWVFVFGYRLVFGLLTTV